MGAGLPLLYIDALEYAPVEKILEEVAHDTELERTIIRWTPLGMYDEADKSHTPMDLEKALNILLKDKKNLRRRLLVIEDVHFFLDKPEIIARLREMARLIDAEDENVRIHDFTVALVAPLGSIPKELEAYLTLMTPDFLTPDEIKGIIQKFVDENDVPELEPSFLETLSMEMKGLSEAAIINILSLAYQNDGKIDDADLALVREQKKQTVKKSGILEMVELKETINDIGGLENLKEWLARKAAVFNNSAKVKELVRDLTTASAWHKKTADAGDAVAMYALGLLYLHDDFSDRDETKAAEWFQRGAEAGDGNAMNALGYYTIPAAELRKTKQRQWNGTGTPLMPEIQSP